MSKNLIALSLLLSTLQLFSDETMPIACDPAPHFYRAEIKHREHQGIGYKTGYTSLDLFVPYWDNGTSFLFVDGRGHIFDNGKWAANGGLGLRYLIDNWNMFFGINAYYDFRQAEHRGNFHQVGGGVEFLGKVWDVRGNLYWPVGSTTQLDKPGSLYFKGYNALLKRRAQYAMRGGNGEVGAYFISRKYFKGHLAAGGYYFTSSHIKKKAVGPTVRLTAEISPYFTLEGQYSYDPVFKNIVQGVIALNIPFGPRVNTNSTGTSCSGRFKLEQRVIEPVQRFEIIVEKDKKQTFYALSSLTGKPLNFIFVNNLAPDADGSFERPYPTLLQAESNSKSGDAIYVHAGDGTSKGMDEGITLKDNQMLLGSASPFTFSTKLGAKTMAPQSSISPTVTTGNSNIIELANNNVINGLNILQTIETASIQSPFHSLTSLTVTNNTFTATGIAETMSYAIKLDSLVTSGTITISNNTINQFISGLRIATKGSYSLTVSSNTMNNNFLCLDIFPTGPGAVALSVLNNTLQSFSGSSSSFSYFDINSSAFTAVVTAVVENNIINLIPTDANAFFFFGNGSLLLKNNTINSTSGALSVYIQSALTSSYLTAVIRNNTLTGGFGVFNSNVMVKILENTSPGNANFYSLNNVMGGMTLSSPNGTLAGGTYNQNFPNTPDTFIFPSTTPDIYPVPQTEGDSFP
jgi:hypothetical protein